MRFIALCSIALLTLETGTVFAESKIKIDDGISVIARNGKLISDSDYLNSSKNLKLETGTNQLLARYSVELNNADADIEHSHTFALLFTANSDQTLTLSAPVIRKQRALDAFNRKGNWSLSDSSGKAIAFKQSALIKEGFQLSRNYAQELADFNQTNAAAAFYKASTPVSRPAPASDIKTNTVVNSDTTDNMATESAIEPNISMPLKMLKYWYNQADSKNRSEFKVWIAQ